MAGLSEFFLLGSSVSLIRVLLAWALRPVMEPGAGETPAGRDDTAATARSTVDVPLVGRALSCKDTALEEENRPGEDAGPVLKSLRGIRIARHAV